MRNFCLATAAVMMASSFAALPAMAATCTAGQSLDNTSCTEGNLTIDGLTFSQITVSGTTSGTGTITFNSLATINPFDSEFGLILQYAANTGSTAGSVADVALTFTVTGGPITDAIASLAATQTGTGQNSLSEILSNGITLTLNAAGSTSTSFPGVTQLGVIKDQNNFAGEAGSAEASVVENLFSTSAVPIPGTLPLLGAGLAGLWGLARRKKQATATA